MKNALINASNLHVGGGVQVAASFIHELSKMRNPLPGCEITVYVSSEVDLSLVESGFDRSSLEKYFVFNVYGLDALKSKIGERFSGFNLVFTIFGPLYLAKSIENHIVGFAQAWIIYPSNEVNRLLSTKVRWFVRFKFLVQWWFFRRVTRLVVELPHVKEGLLAKSFPANRIDVVNNCVSSIYFESRCWTPVPGLNCDNDSLVKIGYVSRDYPHKNMDFLLDVFRELKRISSINFRFYVTLSESEWGRRSDEFRKNISNIGSLSVTQCPTFYQAMDAVFFPSLLESFSVTPLEAMVMKRPLFASDRGFVRDCCGENAFYYDPLDADAAANRIEEWFGGTSEEVRAAHVERAYAHVLGLPGSRDRASAYIEIIEKQLIL